LEIVKLDRDSPDDDPLRYLSGVLAKIGTTPKEQLSQFLPDVWKREAEAELMMN